PRRRWRRPPREGDRGGRGCSRELLGGRLVSSRIERPTRSRPARDERNDRPVTPEEFADLTEPHLGVLHRMARRLTRTRADAEDLAQEGLVRAFERRASLRDPTKIRS